MTVPTIPRVFLDRARANPQRVATHRKERGAWVGQTWAEGEQVVRNLAAGLMDLGVGPGDRVAILGDTSPRWAQADMAALSLGAVTVGIYTTCTVEQVRYHLEHSGAKVVFAQGPDLLAKTRAAAEGLDPQPAAVLFENIEV